MVSKVTIFIAIGLLGAFILAGGGALTKATLDKTKAEFKLIESGISARTANTKEKSA